MTPEKLLADLELFKTKNRSDFIDALKEAVKSSTVPRFDQGDERPCQDNDFEEYKKSSEISLSNVKLILDECVNSNFFAQNSSTRVKAHPDIDNELLAVILITCGENVSLKPWNTETVVNICNSMLSSVLQLFNCDTLPVFFADSNRKNLIKEIFQTLNPKLLSKTWKHFPASVVCYKWVLKAIEQPLLSDYLQMALPTALLLVDDFVSDNKISGVECLSHIVNNITAAELQFCGHGDVIYSALISLLRIREASIISCTIPCLVSLTFKLEKDFNKKSSTKWSKFDNILEIYLENMELEQIIDLQNSYISHLEFLIGATGSQVVKWSKRLLRIFKEYLQVATKHQDGKTTNYCLKAIEKYIDITKGQVNVYKTNLLFTLLIAIDNMSSNSNSKMDLENKEIVYRLCKVILQSQSESERNSLKNQLDEKLNESGLNSLRVAIEDFWKNFK